jgi:hypothetical protein
MQKDSSDKRAPNAEDQPDEPETEGGSERDTSNKLPFVPADDDSAVGDTDQHSNA